MSKFPKGDNGRLLRKCERAGLGVKRGAKHWKVYGPDGRIVAVVGPHRGNGPDRARAALRRLGVDAG